MTHIYHPVTTTPVEAGALSWGDRLRPSLPELLVALRQRRYKMTRQRAAVLEALMRLGHASAESLHREARKSHRKVSLATVYNCLELLRHAGCLQEFSIPGSSSTFEIATAPHPHRICYRCGQLEDLEEELLGDLRARLVGEQGFQLRDLALQLYGICARCQPVEAAATPERRRFQRAETHAQAQLLPIQVGRLRAPLRGTVRSLGEGGMLLELEERPELSELTSGGGRMKVRFQLPAGEGSVRGEGEVVRLERSDGKIGLGLRFVRLHPAQRQRIVTFLGALADGRLGRQPRDPSGVDSAISPPVSSHEH